MRPSQIGDHPNLIENCYQHGCQKAGKRWSLAWKLEKAQPKDVDTTQQTLMTPTTTMTAYAEAVH